MQTSPNPLSCPPPVEVPLAKGPLIRVLAQVQFPEIMSVNQRSFVASFQEAIRQTYPMVLQEQLQGSVLPGLPQTAGSSIWRFGDTDGHWRVSLAPHFVALETTKYVDRNQFFERFRSVLHGLSKHIRPSHIDRLGVRYFNCILGSAVEKIETLLRPEINGILGTLPTTEVLHALSETMFELPSGRLLTRWGHLPAHATVDPAIFEPQGERSWIFDLDMSSIERTPMIADDLVVQAIKFSERIYAFFRWAVTDEMISRYGGQL